VRLKWKEEQRLETERAELMRELEATLSPEVAQQVESIIFNRASSSMSRVYSSSSIGSPRSETPQRSDSNLSIPETPQRSSSTPSIGSNRVAPEFESVVPAEQCAAPQRAAPQHVLGLDAGLHAAAAVTVGTGVHTGTPELHDVRLVLAQ
jgi:hypothetical protein